MAKFCIVAPPEILEGLQKDGALGQYHLLLAHDIMESKLKQQLYENLFNQWDARWNPNRTIILDNSVIETGNSVDLPMIIGAAKMVAPSVTVLPDVLEDCEATIESCCLAVELWSQEFRRNNIAPDFMYVPQGKTIQEFTKAAVALASHRNITYWGVPRNLVKLHGGREQAIRVCHALNPGRKIHMLGFSDNMVDDMLCSRMSEVSTIDSAVPLRIAEPFSVAMDIAPRGNWWEEAKYSERVAENVKLARKFFAA